MYDPYNNSLDFYNPVKNVDTTFGIYRRKRWDKLQMGSEIVGANENTLNCRRYRVMISQKVFWAFIMLKTSHKLVSGLVVDYRTHKSLSAQTKVKSHPNPRGSTRRRATWKYKHMLKRMYLYLGKVYQRKKKKILKAQTLISMGDGDILSTDSGILSPGMPSPVHTRSYGKN